MPDSPDGMSSPAPYVRDIATTNDAMPLREGLR